MRPMVDSSVSSLASTFESDRDRGQWGPGKERSAPGARGHFRTMNRLLPPPSDPIARGKAWHERLRQYPPSVSSTARNSPSNSSTYRAIRHPAIPSPARNVRALSAQQRHMCAMPPSHTYYQRPNNTVSPSASTTSSMLRHRENDIRQHAAADNSIVWRARENDNRRYAEEDVMRRAQVEHASGQCGVEDGAHVTHTSGRFDASCGRMPGASHRTEDTLNEDELVEQRDEHDRGRPTFLCRMNEELVATALSHLRLGRDLLGPTTCERAVSSVLEQCRLALLELRRRLDIPCNCDPHFSRRTPSSGSGSRRGVASPDSRHGPDIYCRGPDDSHRLDAHRDVRKQRPSSRSYFSRSTADCTTASHGQGGQSLSSGGQRHHSQSSRSLHDTLEHSQESPHHTPPTRSRSQGDLHRSAREDEEDREYGSRRYDSQEGNQQRRGGDILAHKESDCRYESSKRCKINQDDKRRNRPDDGSEWRLRSRHSGEDAWHDGNRGDDRQAYSTFELGDRHAQQQQAERSSPGDRDDASSKRNNERTHHSEKTAGPRTNGRVGGQPYQSHDARQLSDDCSPIGNEHSVAHASNPERRQDTSSSSSILVRTPSQNDEYDTHSGRDMRHVKNEYGTRGRRDVRQQHANNEYDTHSGESSPTPKISSPFASDGFQLDVGLKPAAGNEDDKRNRVGEEATRVLEEDDMSLQSLVRIHEGLEDLEALRRSLKKKVCAPQLGLSELEIHWGEA
eukprot:GEMP01014213.1.p1 GENE.GEMP01014213.1~~GEMP01014213.1.p1  ORF type:complete len:736 (+),score=199.57 GEMP01014213.1:82-2289(+)